MRLRSMETIVIAAGFGAQEGIRSPIRNHSKKQTAAAPRAPHPHPDVPEQWTHYV